MFLNTGDEPFELTPIKLKGPVSLESHLYCLIRVQIIYDK